MKSNKSNDAANLHLHGTNGGTRARGEDVSGVDRLGAAVLVNLRDLHLANDTADISILE